MSKLTGNGLVEFVKSKLGTDYAYAFKMVTVTRTLVERFSKMYPKMYTKKYIQKSLTKIGKTATDCSGLIAAYTGKRLSSAQLYQQAYTRIPIAKIKEFAIGTVLWKNGHVGVYIGMKNGIPMCIEAKGIDYGTVETKVSDTRWVCGLTFDWLSLEYTNNLIEHATWKGVNPYKEPIIKVTSNLNAEKLGIKSYISSGEDVKWVQWELCEAGYKSVLDKAGGIDGKCGVTTLKCIKAFQMSCKITSDGLVGPETRKLLKQ